MTQGLPLPADGSTTTATTIMSTASQSGEDQLPLEPEDNSATDRIAAVTIALLACCLVMTLMVIVHAIRKRRRLMRGEELNHIPTVSAGIMGANVGAYTSQQPLQPAGGVISWEPVTASTSADPGPSTAGQPSRC